MSMLDRGHVDVTVFLEEAVTDADGNIMTRPSETGTPARIRMDPAVMTGTSARRAEQDNEGFETEQQYTCRFPRSFQHVIGAQSQLEWNGRRWAMHGDRFVYDRSHRTAHFVYRLRRF